jgi:thioredoxin-like negative regulator of GroEL
VIEQLLQGDRLLQVDQVDQARDIYQRVFDLDPGNAIAVVGLAQCALADGEDGRAHELAAKALTIDPENDMARRMEARLSEILATRGEAVERPDAAATPSSGEMRPIVTAAAPPSSRPDTAQTSQDPTAAGSTSPSPSPTPSPSTRPAMRKSLFDRLLGR